MEPLCLVWSFVAKETCVLIMAMLEEAAGKWLVVVMVMIRVYIF